MNGSIHLFQQWLVWLEFHKQTLHRLFLMLLGVCLLSGGVALESHAYGFGGGTNFSISEEPEIDEGRLKEATNLMMTYIEGSFGALIMVCAGIGAILSSAFGQYRAALSCLIVAVGSFILRSLINTFFPEVLEN